MLVDPIDPTLVAILEPYCQDYIGKFSASQAPTSTVQTTFEKRPFVTLTYAQSLDSRISAKPGVQTKILGPQTKAMTHYIRSKHDAILVGAGTVRADNHKLNCRYPSGKSPIPVILDPRALWDYERSQLRQIHELGAGLAPLIIVDNSTNVGNTQLLEEHGGMFVRVAFHGWTNDAVWASLLEALLLEGIVSIIIECAAKLITALLMSPPYVPIILITLSSAFL